MEKYTVFMDWKNQYRQNGNFESNLQIQCNPYQATNVIFHRTRTNNFKTFMETQQTLKSQSNLHIQHNPYQTSRSNFYRTITNIFITCMETPKTLDRQNALEKED